MKKITQAVYKLLVVCEAPVPANVPNMRGEMLAAGALEIQKRGFLLGKTIIQ